MNEEEYTRENVDAALAVVTRYAELYGVWEALTITRTAAVSPGSQPQLDSRRDIVVAVEALTLWEKNNLMIRLMPIAADALRADATRFACKADPRRATLKPGTGRKAP